MTNCKKTFTPDFRKCGFLCVGRNQLKALFSEDVMQNQLSFLLLCVQTHAYFGEGKVWKGDCVYNCHAGEWITSIREIACMTKMDRRRIGELLKALEEMNFLTAYPVGGLKRITLTNYSPKMLVKNNPSFGSYAQTEEETSAGFFRSASDLYSPSQNIGEA